MNPRSFYNLGYRFFRMPWELGTGRAIDLAPRRDRYLDNVLPLAAPGARFLLWCFEWRPRRLDRLTGFMPMAPGEVERRFRAEFADERVAGTGEPNQCGFVPGNAAYLMTLLPVGAR